MNPLVNSSPVYVEITQHWLKALRGEEGLEIRLERLPDGKLTNLCREQVAASLHGFLKRKSWEPRARAFCAIGARGVSIRRITLPSANKEEFQRLLRLQIENEFPLSPDELAWGCRSLGESRQNGSTRQELLVMAVKKDVIEEYSSLLSQCGLAPVFTLAALARTRLCPQAAGSYALLDVAGETSELILLDDTVPAAVRTVHWGDTGTTSTGTSDPIAESLPKNWSGTRLFVSGSTASLGRISSSLNRRLNGTLECEALPVPAGTGRTAAILGLKKQCEDIGSELLLFHSAPANGKAPAIQSAPLKWAGAAAALVLLLLLSPYGEALLFKPWLARKYAAVNGEAGKLSAIDREMSFLQFLKRNQPAYLDALYLFAKAAPPGSRMDSLTMNRRGEVSLRGSMRNADQVSDFRSRLIDSGFFANVSVDEQTPTPDRQKVNVRMTAQWKSPEALQTLSIGPTADEIERAKNRKDTPAGMPGGMPAGAMPVGLPAGVVIPAGAATPALPPGVVVPAGTEIKVATPKPPKE